MRCAVVFAGEEEGGIDAVKSHHGREHIDGWERRHFVDRHSERHFLDAEPTGGLGEVAAVLSGDQPAHTCGNSFSIGSAHA